MSQQQIRLKTEQNHRLDIRIQYFTDLTNGRLNIEIWRNNLRILNLDFPDIKNDPFIPLSSLETVNPEIIDVVNKLVSVIESQ